MRFTGGLPETACGYGSTLAATERLRVSLPALLAVLEIRSLLDAPCGDLNWISRTDLGRVTYIGVDASEQNLATGRQRAPKMPTARLDVLFDPLPRMDAVLCRDFLQHLPDQMVQVALANIMASGARWLLATSHEADENEDIERPGDFRPLNLKIAPHGLGEPVEAIEDGPGRIIGVWRLC